MVGWIGAVLMLHVVNGTLISVYFVGNCYRCVMDLLIHGCSG